LSKDPYLQGVVSWAEPDTLGLFGDFYSVDGQRAGGLARYDINKGTWDNLAGFGVGGSVDAIHFLDPNNVIITGKLDIYLEKF
jgi:hypothetical protein